MSHLRDPIGLDDSLVVLPGQPPAIAAATSVAGAPVTAGRATTGSAIGATPLSNVVKLISERDWAGACCRISKE